MQYQRVVVGPALGLEYLIYRLTVKAVGAEAVDGLGREGHQAP